MRLSQIKLAGFKSFVDPTHIPLPGQLVGMVGPNGCGKSNVIDAVRWVLGESRASALRGESMQDVIFNGSAKRKPVSRASVELIFDNSLGKAAGQWSQLCRDFGQARADSATASPATYINNQHVRRKDITDIFLGTGLGARLRDHRAGDDLAHHRGQAGRAAHFPRRGGRGVFQNTASGAARPNCGSAIRARTCCASATFCRSWKNNWCIWARRPKWRNNIARWRRSATPRSTCSGW